MINDILQRSIATRLI